MICEICHIREATARITQVVNLEKKEISVCPECAEKKGLSNPMAGIRKLFGDIYFEKLLKADTEPEKEADKTKCNACKTTWADFKDEGLLGCSECYKAFEGNLKSLLRRIHGSDKHIGNRPANLRDMKVDVDLNELKKKLKSAIEQQKYEVAAKLRDQIRDIEANLNRKL